MREDWELFQYDYERGSTYVRRLAVPGGWLYQVSFTGPPDSNNFQTPVFVPTPINVERRAADLSDEDREALASLRSTIEIEGRYGSKVNLALAALDKILGAKP